MITINPELCDGCGVCVETCPDGALYLVDGKAMVDADLCRECEACITACPREAIAYLPKRVSPQAIRPEALVPRPEPEVIQVRTQPSRVSLRSRVLPLVGATAAWAGRELLPVMVDYLIDRLERRVAQQPRPADRSGSGNSSRGGGGGGQRRRRHRGGRNGAN